ncbi:hypothetical protein [Saprospira grandis]|uniref:Uncharacterized protein n=1 Tax=Saprospira grandis (strain Lewin) TaxID=984262 RepID=H6KZA4_SAPGL|nr:hypothetical protein [Saprospira grandis]AFC24494.1 hypothetical protein SGRA_1759 [Saprospira grandis str. Lewin]
MRPLYLSFICMLWAVAAFGQLEASIVEEFRTLSEGSQSAFVMSLPTGDSKLVKKAWAKYSKKKFKKKAKYEKGEDRMFTDDARIKDMSTNTVDLYVRTVIVGEDSLEFVLWCNLGVVYLSAKEYPDRANLARGYMQEFASLIFLDILKAREKEEKAALKLQEKAAKKQEKAIAKLAKKIEKYQEEIAKIEAKIGEVEEEKGKEEEILLEQEEAIKAQKEQIKQSQQAIQLQKKKT